jgi:hypothetical protein
VITVYTASGSVRKLRLAHILTPDSHYSVNVTTCLGFVMETACVLCEVRTESLCSLLLVTYALRELDMLRQYVPRMRGKAYSMVWFLRSADVLYVCVCARARVNIVKRCASDEAIRTKHGWNSDEFRAINTRLKVHTIYNWGGGGEPD